MPAVPAAAGEGPRGDIAPPKIRLLRLLLSLTPCVLSFPLLACFFGALFLINEDHSTYLGWSVGSLLCTPRDLRTFGFWEKKQKKLYFSRGSNPYPLWLVAFQPPSNPPYAGAARRLHVLKTMVVPRKVLAAAIIYAARCFTQASPSGTVPSNAAGTPTAPAFVADSGGSTGSNVVSAGVPLSSPTSGQISFRTKTRNGVRGAAPAMCSGVAPASSIGVGVCGRVPSSPSPSAVAAQHLVSHVPVGKLPCRRAYGCMCVYMTDSHGWPPGC